MADDRTSSNRSNRTGQRRWKEFRARVIHRAKQRGPLTCAYCRALLDEDAPPNTPWAVEVDHVVPVAVAPDREYDMTNVVPCCHPCNRRKGRGGLVVPPGWTSPSGSGAGGSGGSSSSGRRQCLHCGRELPPHDLTRSGSLVQDCPTDPGVAGHRGPVRRLD